LIVSLLSQSLYMLKIVSLPQVPVICVIMTSLDGKSSCDQVSVLMFKQISMIARVLAGVAPCGVGYIGVQSLAAIVRLKGLMAGSCSAIIPTPILAKWLLLMRLC